MSMYRCRPWNTGAARVLQQIVLESGIISFRGNINSNPRKIMKNIQGKV